MMEIGEAGLVSHSSGGLTRQLYGGRAWRRCTVLALKGGLCIATAQAKEGMQ